MSPPEPFPYERGDALQALSTSVPPDDGPPSDAAPADQTVREFSEEEYWRWLESLRNHGGALDVHVDDLLDEIYNCEPTFYDWRERRTLDALLDELHEVRMSIRAFEQDVEQLHAAFAQTDTIETQAAENAEMVLSQIKDTYNRAYDLCLYKLDQIRNGWVTATNILISVTILVVTILFWMEFWE